MKELRLLFLWFYATLAFLFFGGMLFTIITQYPNWISNLPYSLEATNLFYSEANPGTFFQLMGQITIPVFLVTIILVWRYRNARNLLLIHFLCYFLIGLGTFLLIYPILGELGAKDISVRPIEEIQGYLDRFFIYDAIRAVLASVSCLFLIFGITSFLKRYYSETVLI
ncbi:hypothetical protein MG296_11870 [Flavobacteriaceae bacterium TK19130]|nr:hypothetical protein [Thermobacterium salinum]